MDQVWHGRKVPYMEMLVIQRTVFGILLLMHQSSSVALPETIKPSSSLPYQSEVWNYPYPNSTKCKFPYIWQESVDRCCYPFFNCGPGYGIEFCHEDMGNDLCVECRNSFKQYHLVHSFYGENAMCFEVNKYYVEECIEAIKEETIPARGNFNAACGLPCECNPSNCFFGDDPCRCQQLQENCKSNQQMNRFTGVCEACPWYSFNEKEGCGACLVNQTLWMSGSSMVLVSPSPQNVDVSVITTGSLPDSTSEEINARITTLLPETKNAPIQPVVIIGVVVGLVFFTSVVVAVCLIKRRISHARSGSSSSQYTTISQDSVPPIAVANPGPTTEFQDVSETSGLINKQQSNGDIKGQPVSTNNNHLVNHKDEGHMDSHKSSESGNQLGIPGCINERNQSASSNRASSENLTESMEGAHQIIENTGIRNRQENPAEQMEINHGINNIEPSNNLAIAEGQQDMNYIGRQALLTTTDLVDLQTGSNAVQIPHHKTDDQNKGRGILYENQNIVHAEITDPPSSILFSSDSNNPCSSNHQMEKNLDGKIKLQLRKDIEDPNYFLGTNPFMRGSPVENSHCWSFPRDSVADNDSFTVAQTPSGYENVAPNSYPQAICTGDDVDKRTNNNSSTPVKECNSSATRGPDLKTPNHEGGTCCEDSKIPNEEPRIPSEEDHPQSHQYLTVPLSPTSPSNSSTFRPFLNGSISTSTEDEAVAQDTVTQAVCTGDIDKSTNDNSSKAPVKEVVRVLPLNTSANRSLHLGAPNQESGTCSEDSRILNEEPQIHSEEGHPQSPQCSTMPLSPTSASNSSIFRPFLNRSISSSTDRPTAKVTPMRQQTQSQRQDEGTLENDDSMSTDSSTDISMSYGVVHIAGGLSLRDESFESSDHSLSSSCEDAPPSFSHATDPPSTTSHTQMENTGFRRTGGMRSATRNGSQVPMMGSQSRGGPDGASVPSNHRANRVMEPRQVFETEVKEPEQSEETDPKTLLSSTQERDRTELERQDSDSEDHSEKIGFNQTEDLEKLRDLCEGLVYPGSLSDAAKNSSDKVQGKTLRKDFKAVEANASHKESNLRNVPLYNDDQVQYNNWSFLSELEDEENKLNSTARSKCDTGETSHSYSSLQNRDDIQIKTKSVEDSGKDDIFQDSKSSLEEIAEEADGSFSDTDPDEESSSDQGSSHSDDEGVCSNGDAELNRELQQPSQIDVHNEFNSSSLSINSEESGIDTEEQNIQNLQDC